MIDREKLMAWGTRCPECGEDVFVGERKVRVVLVDREHEYIHGVEDAEDRSEKPKRFYWHEIRRCDESVKRSLREAEKFLEEEQC